MKTILRGDACVRRAYECTGDPGNASYCHCDDCKRATGGPYTVGVLVRAADLRILSGQVKGYTSAADSGKKITREFCPNCGAPLFTRAEKLPDRSSSRQALWISRSWSSPLARHGRNGRSPGPTSMRRCRAFRKAVRPEQMVPGTEHRITSEWKGPRVPVRRPSDPLVVKNGKTGA